MAKTDKSTERLLEDRKAQLVRRLSAVAPEDTQELLLTMESIFALRSALPPVTEEFVGFTSAIDAVIELLKRTKRPMRRTEIVKALVSGGFGKFDPGVEKNIRSAIDYAVNVSKKLRVVEGKLIDLPETQTN